MAETGKDYRGNLPRPAATGRIAKKDNGRVSEDELHGQMRKLYLEQGWGYTRIASFLKVSVGMVDGYLKRNGLVEKKKTGTWGPDDVLLPSEEVHAVLERAKKQEKAKVAAARIKGAELAERVVAEVLTREEMAKETLTKIAVQADSIAARMKQAIDDMQEMQEDGKATLDKGGNVVMIPGTNMRDFKDLTASYLNIIRATRELAGEDNNGKPPEKHMPVRIGVIGSVRISGGGVTVEEQPGAGRREPVALTVDAG